MNPQTVPAPPNYSTWTLAQLQSTQSAYLKYLGLAAYPPHLCGLPWRADTTMYQNWLDAITSEIGKRPA